MRIIIKYNAELLIKLIGTDDRGVMIDVNENDEMISDRESMMEPQLPSSCLPVIRNDHADTLL